MLVLSGIALVCALTAAADVTTQPAMDVTQLLQQLQTEIQEFRGIKSPVPVFGELNILK